MFSIKRSKIYLKIVFIFLAFISISYVFSLTATKDLKAKAFTNVDMLDSNSSNIFEREFAVNQYLGGKTNDNPLVNYVDDYPIPVIKEVVLIRKNDKVIDIAVVCYMNKFLYYSDRLLEPTYLNVNGKTYELGWDIWTHPEESFTDEFKFYSYSVAREVIRVDEEDGTIREAWSGTFDSADTLFTISSDVTIDKIIFGKYPTYNMYEDTNKFVCKYENQKLKLKSEYGVFRSSDATEAVGQVSFLAIQTNVSLNLCVDGLLFNNNNLYLDFIADDDVLKSVMIDNVKYTLELHTNTSPKFRYLVKDFDIKPYENDPNKTSKITEYEYMFMGSLRKYITNDKMSYIKDRTALTIRLGYHIYKDNAYNSILGAGTKTTFVYFNLEEIISGYNIPPKDLISLSIKYKYRNELYSNNYPLVSYDKINFAENLFLILARLKKGNFYTYLTDNSYPKFNEKHFDNETGNKYEYLFLAKSGAWGRWDKAPVFIEDFDAFDLLYYKENMIIRGAFNSEGLHVEYNDDGTFLGIYDMNGILRDGYTWNDENKEILRPDGSVVENDLVIKEGESEGKSGLQLPDQFYNIGENINNWFKNTTNNIKNGFNDLALTVKLILTVTLATIGFIIIVFIVRGLKKFYNFLFKKEDSKNGG